MSEDEDDHRLLQAIRDHCAAQSLRPCQPTAEAHARRRAYQKVARAASELLTELDA